MNESAVQRETIEQADLDLATRQVSSLRAQALVLGMIILVTHLENLKSGVTWLTVIACLVQAVARVALLFWRKPFRAYNPQLWRWGLFSCVCVFGLAWGCFCAVTLGAGGPPTWTSVFAVGALFAVAPLGLNSTVSSRAAQLAFLLCLIGPYLLVVLHSSNQHSGSLSTIAVGTIFYCVLHGRSLSLEYWGRIRANVILAAQAANLERTREVDSRLNRTLEMLLSSASVEDVLEHIAEIIPHQITDTAVAILKRDNDHLVAASSRYANPDIREFLQTPLLLEEAQRLPARFGPDESLVLFPIAGGTHILGGLLLSLPPAFSDSREQRAVIHSALRMCALAFEHHAAKERLEYQVHHDSLTGLPNRVFYAENLKSRIAAAARDNSPLSLLYIDLDGFKQINDSLGHEVGDRFLQVVSQRLRASLRTEDVLARIGGDEFVAVIEADGATAEDLAIRMNENLRQRLVIDGVQVKGSASIGLSVFPQDGREIEELQRNADYAMFRAKNEGKGRCFTFSPSIRHSDSSKAGIERELRRALRDQLFTLHYQPQFHPCGTLAGVEGLIRIAHPELGLMQPGDFIPVAEKTGLIVPIGARVLVEACRQIKAWRAAGLNSPRVAVNVSAVQFARYDFSHSVWQILNESGVDPGTIELELTESTVVADIDQAIRQMEAIRDLGVRLSIDDFGTGYSSLNYLHRLPVHAVKIDRSFVEDLDSVTSTYPLLESIVAVARKLHLEVIAEGVETVKQHRCLSSLGIDSMQGFYLGRPMPATDVVRFLSAQTESPMNLTTA